MAPGVWFHLKATQVKIRNSFFYNWFQKDLVARCHDLCLLHSSRTDCAVCFGTQIRAFSFDIKHLKHTKDINGPWALFSPLVCAFCFLEDPEPFYILKNTSLFAYLNKHKKGQKNLNQTINGSFIRLIEGGEEICYISHIVWTYYKCSSQK